MAHDTNHGGAGHGTQHGGAQHDVNPDKGAAFIGLFAGMVLLGAFLFGMVTWTNHHLGSEEPRANATSTK